MTDFILNDYLMLEERFSKIGLPKETYTKPTCEVVEIDPIEMIAMSGEGSDTEDDFEFGGERTFESTRNRGEWGDLWSK